MLRLNENGRVAVLTASFTPSAGARTFQVYSAANFTVGDTIYISNASAGGSLGLKGTITTINGTSITIAAGYITSAGAIFDTGSVVHRVTEVTYDSPADGAGITRNNGSGLIRVVPTSSFLLAYYDSTGAVLTPPLSAATIQNQLCAIGVTTSVISSSKMKNGTNYTSTAQDRIALRNLILSR